MNEHYLYTAMRYVELNPVKAGIVEKAWKYPWSSTTARIKGKPDALISLHPTLDTGKWKKFLNEGISEEETENIRYCERTGRPLGDEHFLKLIENLTGRDLRKKKSGPKPKK